MLTNIYSRNNYVSFVMISYVKIKIVIIYYFRSLLKVKVGDIR